MFDLGLMPKLIIINYQKIHWNKKKKKKINKMRRRSISFGTFIYANDQEQGLN